MPCRGLTLELLAEMEATYGAAPAAVRKPWRCPHGCTVENELTVDEVAELCADVGLYDGPMRSTNANLNGFLDQHDAWSWHWNSSDLVMMAPDYDE